MYRYPVGVVGGITPFNFPMMVPAWMFPLAIAVGNTMAKALRAGAFERESLGGTLSGSGTSGWSLERGSWRPRRGERNS